MKGKKGMKRGITAAVLTVLLLVSGSVGGYLVYNEIKWTRVQQDAMKELEENKGEYAEERIVLYDTTLSEARALADKFGATLRITGDGKFATLTLQNGTTVEDVYAARSNRKYLPELSLDYKAKTSEEAEDGDESDEKKPSAPDYAVSDTYYAQQTYLKYLNIGKTWSTTKGSGITVAVIDTGIDTDHPEFAGKISEYSYNATEDKIVKDYTTEEGGYDWSLIEDEQGHGTAVSGTIASEMNGEGIVGISSEVNLLVIKAACDQNGSFYSTSDLVFGVYYAIERDVDVINMSFGGYSPVNPYATATKLAVESDIVCVAAAGNDGTTQLCYPAADENVMGVGALSENSWELASYSNYGENTDMVAPGTVYTTKKGGEYGVMRGTSFASPIAAGAVALYLSQNRYQTFEDVQELLYASCYDLGSLGKDWEFGYGALDISALVCEEKGTVTFDYLTDEIDTTTQTFVRNHTLQNLPEPERLYAVFDGWYYDIQCTEELDWYADKFTTDLTLYANWVNEEDGIPYTYVTKDDGTVEIRSYTGKRKYITIPDLIEGKPVTGIGDFAFSGQSGLREINLPEGLTEIGRYAFVNCNNLTKIALPDGVTTIGEYAFYNNVRLSDVILTDKSELSSVGDFAFGYCSGLSRFELPKGVRSINGSAFYGATALKSIGVKEGNTAYQSKEGVLFNNTSSTLIAYPAGLNREYVVPDGVRSIGGYAFAYAKLKTPGLGSVQTIGEYAFSYSASENVTLPNSVTSLGMGAFAYNFNLRRVTIGSGLTGIPVSGFSDCYALENIEIPANVREIGASAFANDYSLTSVTFADGSNLTQIGNYAFMYTSLRSVELPASLVIIGGYAFANDFALSGVTFEENCHLQVIGGSAFFNAVSLTEIVLPGNLMQIGDYAFRSSGLKEATLPASVNYLGAGAFAACQSLVRITVESGNTQYKDVNGVVYNTTASEIVAYPAGNPATVYALENTATAVGEAAFYGAHNLGNVILPSALETVKKYGFYDCVNIAAYDLPESLMYIEAYAFSCNTSLSSLQLPDNVIQISNYAFADDYKLRNVTFNETSKLPRISYAAFAYTGLYSFRVPSSVSTVAQNAFAGCNDLTRITFAANSKLESVSAYMFQGCNSLQYITFENGSALTNIQAHGFEGMNKLLSVDFGDAKIANIDNYAFRYCEALQTLVVPEGVTYIGRYAFYGDKALTRLDLPRTIEYIGRYAFYGASGLNVYFANDTLPLYLQENWDAGINGYYVGVKDVVTDGDWQYAVLNSGNISLIKYTGTETTLDLTALDLGGAIVSVGGYAFYMSDVTSIVLPETLTGIQAYAFARSALTDITIPASVEYIAKYAFFYTPLERVTFAENGNLKVTEQWAFAYTRSLTNVTLPASLETMGSAAFYMSGITAARFADGSRITEIPEQAFASTKLTSVVIPDSVTRIDHNAFRDCEYLASVAFGAGERLEVRSNAFYNTGLTELYIPANLEYIGEYALVGLQRLTAFIVAEDNPYYSSANGLLYTKDGKKLVAVPAAREGKITLPETLENIGFGAFENSSVSEIEFSENGNILSIGYRAFYNAGNLTTVTIPASVVSIDYYAFAMSGNLETVIFAEGSRLTGVYEGAFYGCKSLKNILLPDSVVEISDFAFYGCTSLTDIPVSETNELKGIYSYAFAYTGITELTVPDSVIDIGEYAFRGAKLEKVTVPDTNREQLIIGIGAFQDCNDLTEITLPFIGASFEDMDVTWFGYIFGAGGYMANSTYVPESLKTVTITEGITFVGTGAFYNIETLEKINIPHSVSMVYFDAFYGTTARYELTNIISSDNADNGRFGVGISGKLVLKEGIKYVDLGRCAFLESVELPNGVISADFRYCSKLLTVNIPKSVTSIGGGSFLECNSLTSIEIPNSVTSIGDDAFQNCSSLTSIEIPDSVTSIEYATFLGCSSLTSIEIPSGVTSIGDHAFLDCSGLTSVAFGDNSQLTRIGDYAFLGCSSLRSIEIPDSVTSIGISAFYMCSRLTSVRISNELTTIGSGGFAWCSGLTRIEVPSKVTNIGEGAFSGCVKLYEIINHSDLNFTLGSGDNGDIAYYAKMIIDKDGNKTYLDETNRFEYIDTADGFRFVMENGEYKLITYFGTEDTVILPENINGNSYVLYELQCVKNVIIPEGFVTINDYAFQNSESLKSVIIPESVTSIGEAAFCGCGNLENVIFRENSQLTNIDYSAFSGCFKLASIEIPESVTSIGEYAFYNCIGLASIKIPAGVTSIGSGTFYGCSCLTSIEIPSGVTNIGWNAFYNCIGLASIKIPAGVTSIGNNAFSGCRLENIFIDENNTSFTVIDGIVYNKEITQIIMVSDGVTSVVIPASVTDISSVFSGKTNLKTVVFEEGSKHTNIGEYAFSGCSSLTGIIIPEEVTSIGQGVFYHCSSLKSIEIPNGVTSIGSSAFEGCNSLTSIEIPEGVTSIGSATFSNCSSLTSIAIPKGVTSIEVSAFYGCYGLKSIEIPAGVTSIGDWAFRDCRSLTSIKIPNGVTSIGYSAFSYCSSLTSIEIPESVTVLGDRAFENCNGLVNIEIPEGVTSIGNNAFYACTGLTSIEIPSSVTSIGDKAFFHCDKLYKIINNSDYLSLEDYTDVKGTSNYGYLFNGAKEVVDNVKGNTCTLEEGFSYIDTADGFRFMTENGTYKLTAYLGSEDTVTLPENINGNAYTIYQMRGVKNIIIPDSFTSINDFAFRECSSLTSVTFENNSRLTSIGSYTFYYCSSLTSIEIPNGVTSIEFCVFYGCSSLTSIKIPNGVTSIRDYAFYGCSSLTSIEIPDNVTVLGNGVFEHCINLEDIVLCDNVTMILNDAFDNTAYYNDMNNWQNACLYIDNALICVDPATKYFKWKEGTTCIATDAFSECYSLTQITFGGDHYDLLSSLTNLETLILTEMPTDYVYSYFGYSTSNIPLTLSAIIIKEGAEVTNSYAYYGITGVNIYVEANKEDVQHWDDMYPGWNNGNKVYYGGEWITAEFYGADGELIDGGIYLTSQVIRQPYLSLKNDGRYSEVLLGWDLDGDGIADSVPATSAKNIVAHAIIVTKLNEYTVNFYDKDGVTVLYSYILPYGATFELPETPVRQGYTFLGWEGYTEGMTVTENVSIYSLWEHNGEHNYIKTTVAPTCTEAGYDLYTCSVCGESYKENYIESAGHVFGEWIIDEEATCESKGSCHRVCEVCGEREEEEIEAIGHNYIGVVTKEATCTENGEITYTCEHCGDVIREQTDKTEHNYVKKIVPKSWLRLLVEKLLNIFFGYEGNNGYYFECTECRHIQTREEAMLLSASAQSTCEHELGEEQLIYAATCEEQGIYGRYCTKCGELISARTVDALGHDYSEIETVLPTCTEQGYDLHTCVNCGDTYKDNFVSALGHEIVHHDGKAATCTEKGWKEYDTCTRCDYTTYEEIPALGHSSAEAVEENRAEATCTEAGHYDSVVYCSVCGEELSRETIVIPALGHEIVHHDGQEATCTEKGWKEYDTCTRCDYTTYEEIPALGHSSAEAVEENRAEATCTEAGHYDSVVYCSVCGEELSRETIVIPALGHDIVHHDGKAATCTEKGWKEYDTCTRCDYTTYEKIPALGHSSAEAVEENRAEATCTEAGHYDSVVYCSVCGEELSRETIVIPALGHEIVHHDGQEATCTEKGWKEYDTCTRCDYTTYEEIPALGHSSAEAVEENRAEATCTEAGHYDSVVYCSVCDEELSRETIVIPVLGHEIVHHEGKAATCTEKGWKEYDTCTRCDYTTYEEIPVIEHIASEWIIDREASEGVAGQRHKECLNCGEILEEEEIPALPVNSSDSVSTDDSSNSEKISLSGGCFGAIGGKNAILMTAMLGVVVYLSVVKGGRKRKD